MKYILIFNNDGNHTFFSIKIFNDSNTSTFFGFSGTLIAGNIVNNNGLMETLNTNTAKHFYSHQGCQEIEKCVNLLNSFPYNTLKHLIFKPLSGNSPEELFSNFEAFLKDEVHIDRASKNSEYKVNHDFSSPK